MKIQFEDNSYIECYKSNKNSNIIIIVSAKDYNNPLKKIVNSVELTPEEFKKLTSEIV